MEEEPPPPGVDADYSESYRDDGHLTQLLVGATGMPYAFTVEVTLSNDEYLAAEARLNEP